MQKLLIVLLVLGAVGSASAQDRIEIFKKNGQRDGYAVIDRERGRIDTYDKNSNRTGSGYIDRYNNSITIYGTGERRGTSKGERSGGRH